MYRIILVCDGLPEAQGFEAAADITEAFGMHYPHEHNVKCTFDGKRLWLVAENDHDPQALNLMDEFSDNLCASMSAFDGNISIVGIETF